MKFLVCGLGSMGRRRIRLLKQIEDCDFVVGYDLNKERCEAVAREFDIDCFSDLNAIDGSLFDCAVVSTSPLTHYEIIKNLLLRRKNVFTEINLISDWYDECLSIAKSNNVKLFISSTLNYRNDIAFIREKVLGSSSVSAYVYHVGQYLPDWHPWESYKDFFVRDKKTNGCREIFAIDLPWIYKTFGEIMDVKVIHSKMSNLDLSYDDSYMVLLNHKNGNHGSLIVDVVSRKAVRTLEVINEDFHINWDGQPNSLELYNPTTKVSINVVAYKEIDKNNNYSSNIIENAYKQELLSFIDNVKHDIHPIYYFNDD